MSIAASVALLALPAAPAAAAPPERFDFPEVCSFIPVPSNRLVCFSQSGRFSLTDTPSGKTIMQAAVTTSSTVYEGPATNGTVAAWSENTQQFSALVRNGEPALFHLRQAIRNDNAASATSCAISVHFVVIGTQIRRVYTDVSCA